MWFGLVCEKKVNEKRLPVLKIEDLKIASWAWLFLGRVGSNTVQFQDSFSSKTGSSLSSQWVGGKVAFDPLKCCFKVFSRHLLCIAHWFLIFSTLSVNNWMSSQSSNSLKRTSSLGACSNNFQHIVNLQSNQVVGNRRITRIELLGNSGTDYWLHCIQFDIL